MLELAGFERAQRLSRPSELEANFGLAVTMVDVRRSIDFENSIAFTPVVQVYRRKGWNRRDRTHKLGTKTRVRRRHGTSRAEEWRPVEANVINRVRQLHTITHGLVLQGGERVLGDRRKSTAPIHPWSYRKGKASATRSVTAPPSKLTQKHAKIHPSEERQSSCT